MRGRGPVHAAQRLARLVLAHAVQLVAAAAQPLAHAQRVAGAGERRLRELERRCDHRQRGAAARRVEPAREAERVLADQLARAELVQPAPQRPELVAAAQHAQAAADDGPQRAGLLHPVLAERRAARPRARERPQLDRDRMRSPAQANGGRLRTAMCGPPARPTQTRASSTAATSAAPSSAISAVPKSRP